MGEFTRVAARSDVPEGGAIGVEANGERICLAECEGEIYAFADKCSHRDFPLATGEIDTDDCTVTCDWHGAKFDMRTGAARSLPATRPVPVYEVRVEGDDVLVNLS